MSVQRLFLLQQHKRCLYASASFRSSSSFSSSSFSSSSSSGDVLRIRIIRHNVFSSEFETQLLEKHIYTQIRPHVSTTQRKERERERATEENRRANKRNKSNSRRKKNNRNLGDNNENVRRQNETFPQPCSLCTAKSTQRKRKKERERVRKGENK